MDYQKDTYPYRMSDIIAGAITHGVGAGLAIAGTVVLIVKAAETGHPIAVVGATIFGTCLILAYTSSTLYHSLARTRARHIFHIFDHSLIYLLIAGTYTPIALLVIRGVLGWTIFITVWVLAIIGIVFKSLMLGRYPRASGILYVAMGWLMVFFIVPLWHTLPPHAIALLFAGGLCYTGGMLFYVFDRKLFFHSVWHVFVMAGSAFHYFLILEYVVKMH